MTLEAPAAVTRGERVQFRLIVVNSADRAVDLHLHGREPTIDVVVARESGEIVWRSLGGQVIPATLQLLTLAPAEHLDVETEWDQRAHGRVVADGLYVVRASLLAEGDPITAAPARLMIGKA